jgi:SAM-dependent methyltransferase
MGDKDLTVPGEIDFSDGELSEMGVDLAGRVADSAPAPRRSRSMLRVPVDEVPRPQGATDPTALSSTTEPSLPAIAGHHPDPADDVVDHAFRNGGVAEGVVPAELRLAATPAKDELEAFTAKLIADRDRVIEMEMEPEEHEPDTDPKALAQLRAAEAGAVPARVVDDGPTREVRATPTTPSRGVNPALAALARAVAAPAAPGEPAWLAPSQTTSTPAEGTGVVEMEAPAGEHDDVDDESADAEMELDDGELEDVELTAPPAAAPAPAAPAPRARSLTPLVPPPPMPEAKPNGHGNGHAVEEAAAAAAATPGTAAPSAPPAIAPLPPPPAPASLSSGMHASPSGGAHAVIAPPPAPPPPTSSSVPSMPAVPPPAPPAPPPASTGTTLPSMPAVPPPAPPSPPTSAAPPPAPASAPVATPPVPPPPAAAAVAAAAAAVEAPLRPRRKRRAKQWFEEIFDDDYLRTLPFLTPRQTEREAQFIAESLQIPSGGALLDLACGYGRHAMELAAKSYRVTGLDLSLPLLIRAADAARRVGVNVNFIHGDMREMTFENEFDGAYCMFTSFGYFDDDTNRKVAANLARAIKPGGKLLIDVVNRDYIVRDLPTRVWWQGDGCVVLEEVDFNYFSSRVQVQRSIIFEDGRQVEQEISIRAYSLHEIGKVLHHSGFRVTEVSGGLSLRGKFFGANSRQLIVVAEKKVTP